MITHHFEKDDGVILSGYFSGDFGSRICSWKWDGKQIEVTADGKMGRGYLTDSELAEHSDEELRERLVEMAKTIAVKLRGEPFPA